MLQQSTNRKNKQKTNALKTQFFLQDNMATNEIPGLLFDTGVHTFGVCVVSLSLGSVDLVVPHSSIMEVV